MEDHTVLISRTANTPEVYLVPSQRTFRISGNSFPEDVEEFYLPIKRFMETLDFSEMSGEAIFELRLEYFNSSSANLIFEILKVLEGKCNEGEAKIKIIWYATPDDEDLKDIIFEYKSQLSVPVYIINS